MFIGRCQGTDVGYRGYGGKGWYGGRRRSVVIAGVAAVVITVVEAGGVGIWLSGGRF